ncbi:hypothetical protein O988_08502 [Pseudogymnoascus sp. VKM F-3808]|nr:hypothetical protein O988_08502 [Pseudogymnoascus sp. VKM F-3808]
MRRNSFLFLQQQWPEQTTQRFWETDFHFFFWLPPVSRSRNDSLHAFGAAKEYRFYEPERLLTQQTHTKGGTPNNRQTKGRDRPPRRPATQKPTAPVPVPVLQQTGHTAPWRVTGSGTARFLRWYPRALLPIPPQPAPLALFCMQTDRAAVDAGGRGRARGRVVAGSLVLLGLSDLPYPPGLCGTVLNYLFFLARGAHVCFAWHRSLGAHPRGVKRGGLGSARWSETERKETGLKGTEEHRTLVVAGRPLGRGACAAGFP